MARYGISTWIVGRLPADEAIDALAEAGFEELELSADWAPLVQMWEYEPARTMERLRAAGMSVRSVHSPESGRHLDVPEDVERQASILENLRYFNLMTQSGIEEIVIHPTSSAPVETPTEIAAVRHRSVESLAVLAEHAGRAGIRLQVENLGRAPRPGHAIHELLELIEGLGDHVGLCHDVGHSVQAGLDVIVEMRAALAADKLFSLHLHDVDADLRDHYIPGEGTVDLPALLDELDAVAFPGGRILEIAVAENNVRARLQEAAKVKKEWESRGRR
ncbi:MAG: sugar phosphate isomerase/epimerase family protein [Candidatus Zipacnadales bacterium]